MSEKVRIKYINRDLCQKYGANPITVSKGHADKLEKKGLVRILPSIPKSNPNITQDEIDEIKKRYEDDSVALYIEDKLLTKVTWITGGFIDRGLRIFGNNCGFKISVVNNSNFTVGKLLLADLIIISSNLEGFNESQLIHLRATIFQKQVPYIYRMEDVTNFDETARHFMMDSIVNFFPNDELFERGIDEVGEMITNWFIETGDYADFWRKINSL